MVGEHKFGGWLVSGNVVFDNRGAGGDTVRYCNMGDGWRKRGGGKRAIAVVACPMVIAVIAGIVGLVIAWLLSDVFVVFGVELGPRVIAWAGCGCAIIGFAVSHAMLHRGVLRAVAVILVVCAVLSAATGIDQAYGEYAPSDHCSAKTPIAKPT